jgi:hypothetical protein
MKLSLMKSVRGYERGWDNARAELTAYGRTTIPAPLLSVQKEVMFYFSLAIAHLALLGVIISRGEFVEAACVAAIAALYGVRAKDLFAAACRDLIAWRSFTYANDNEDHPAYSSKAA